MAMICIPLKAKDLSSLKKISSSALKNADLVEVWVDSMPSVPPETIIGMFKKPLIIVNKGKKEHGAFRGTEKERIVLLGRYAGEGVAYVDVAVDTPKPLLRELFARKSRSTKVILSYHDFTKTPTLLALKKARDKAFRAGAHLFKAAVFARTYEDNLTILRFLAESRRAGKPCIAHCMGEKGRISRILAPLFGSYIIYAAPEVRRAGRNHAEGARASIRHATAPGQLTVSEYKKFFSLLKL